MKQRVKRYRPPQKPKDRVRLKTVPVQVKPGRKAVLGLLVAIVLGLLVAQKTALQQLNYQIAALDSKQEEIGKRLRNSQLHYQQLVSFQRINYLATTRLGMVSRNNQPVIITVGANGHNLSRETEASPLITNLTMRD